MMTIRYLSGVPARRGRGYRAVWSLAAASVLVVSLFLLAAAVAGASGHPARGRVANSTPCTDPYPAARDPSNPLMLSTPPGVNPLKGASFFVDGPAHGAAAGAIARLLGIDRDVPIGQYLPSFDDSESWASFKSFVEDRLAREPGNLGLIRKVRLLEKIANEPEPQRVSIYAEGGGSGAISDFARKLFCHNFTADPGAIPIITTYFLHPALGGCATASEIRAAMPEFKRRVNELVAGTGRRPVVYLLELDAIGSSGCMASNGAGCRHGRRRCATRSTGWRRCRMLSSMSRLATRTRTPSDTPRGRSTRSISTRSAGSSPTTRHINWTSEEAEWAEKVSSRTHGAHYIVNTAQNGNGPKLNPHPTTDRMEDLCNPPGRARPDGHH
jgi:hypothetical protein